MFFLAILLALLDLLDLNALNKGLEAGTQLAGGGIYVFLLDRAHRQTEVTRQHDRVYDALIAPVFAELVGSDYDAVGMVVSGEVGNALLSCAHGVLRHEARAVGGVEIVACDSVKRLLAFLDDDGDTALDSAVAVTVGNDFRAAALDELGEVGVVVLGTGKDDLAAERPAVVGLAGLELLGGLAQVGEDKALRADLADKLDDVELIAGDGGVIKLAVVADLVYQAADLIVALDGLHDGLIGNRVRLLLPLY